jgi:hypothetical protein
MQRACLTDQERDALKGLPNNDNVAAPKLDHARTLVLADPGRGDEMIRLQPDTCNGRPDWALAVEKLRQKHVRAWVGPQRAAFAPKMPERSRGLLASEVSQAWLDGERDADAWPWVIWRTSV